MAVLLECSCDAPSEQYHPWPALASSLWGEVGYNDGVPKKEPPFEESFLQLEDIVRKLEVGGLPLDDSVTLFEEAMRLAKLCNTRLDAAELRITQITASAAEPDGVHETAFHPEAARSGGRRMGALLDADEDEDAC